METTKIAQNKVVQNTTKNVANTPTQTQQQGNNPNQSKKKKITPQMIAQFKQKEEIFKQNLNRCKEFIKKMEEAIKKNPNDRYNGYRQIAIANEYITMVNYYIEITHDMEQLKGVKNESYINEGRKTYYNLLLALEKVFTDVINQEPSEIQAVVESLPFFDPARKIILFRKMTTCLENLAASFGEKSKYKFAFSDMFARYAVIVKNSSNFKELVGRDPRKPFYEENEILTNMLIDALNRAADKLREKYELASKEFEDMKKAIKILEELKRVHTLFGQTAAAEEAKKKVDVWNDKLEKDMKAKDRKEGVGKQQKHKSLDDSVKAATELLKKKK